MAKSESGIDEDPNENPSKAEEIKKEKIAVALTYGTTASTSAPSSSLLSHPAATDHPINSPRTNAPGPAACRVPEPGPAAGPASDHAHSPRSPVSSPAPCDRRPVRARRATPAAAALIASAKAARERQTRSKDKEAAAAAAAVAEEEKRQAKRGARRCRAKAGKDAESSHPPPLASRAKRSRPGRRKAPIPTPPDDDTRSPSDDDAGDYRPSTPPPPFRTKYSCLIRSAGALHDEDGLDGGGMLDDGYGGAGGRLWGRGVHHGLDDESPGAASRRPAGLAAGILADALTASAPSPPFVQ